MRRGRNRRGEVMKSVGGSEEGGMMRERMKEEIRGYGVIKKEGY